MPFNNLLLALALTVLWPLGLMVLLAAAEWLERRTLAPVEVVPRRLRPAAGAPAETLPPPPGRRPASAACPARRLARSPWRAATSPTASGRWRGGRAAGGTCAAPAAAAAAAGTSGAAERRPGRPDRAGGLS
jgi:hypothetical protein